MPRCFLGNVLCVWGERGVECFVGNFLPSVFIIGRVRR